MDDMAKRTIEEINEVDEDERCFTQHCRNDRKYEVVQSHDDEPDKTFYLYLCKDCLTEYSKDIDEAKIFG